MKAPVYLVHSGVITVVIASPRAEPAPSHVLQFAKIHEEFVANVRRALREHRHAGASSVMLGGGLARFFPAFQGAPIYALRELLPAGAARGVDQEFQLETMALRWTFTLMVLPGALAADGIVAEAIERNLEAALRDLFRETGIPDEFIPGDETLVPGDRTAVSIIVEIGQSSGRQIVDIPAGY